MGAKIYSQGAEAFAASCKNHFLQPRKKGLWCPLVPDAKKEIIKHPLDNVSFITSGDWKWGDVEYGWWTSQFDDRDDPKPTFQTGGAISFPTPEPDPEEGSSDRGSGQRDKEGSEP